MDFQIAHEFVDVETAKMAGRKNFGEMVRYLEKSPAAELSSPRRPTVFIETSGIV